MTKAIFATGLMVFACGPVYGQSGGATPTFDVASIKPAPPPEMKGDFGKTMMRMGSNGGPGTKDPGLYTCTNCNLSMLVMQAYNIKPYQLTGLDSSFGSSRFNVTAKVPEGATKEQFQLMLQNLLAERFKLVVHHDKKETQVYELVVGKNGPKFKESAPETAPKEDEADSPKPPQISGPPKLDKDGYPVLPPGARGRGPMMMMMNGRMRMMAQETTMEQFATTLSNMIGKPVTDATGLKGKYDLTLSFGMEGMGMMKGPQSPDGGGRGTVIAGVGPGPGGPGGPGGPMGGAPDGGGDPGPTIFSAVQTDLGLKLEQKKGQVDLVVVDHFEKAPTEN